VILIAVAMPNMSFFGANQRLRNLAEQLQGHLQQSRGEAIARNTRVYTNFAVDGTESWEYGFSSVNSGCDLAILDPTTAGACIIVVNDGDAIFDLGNGALDTADLVLTRFTSDESRDVKMDIAGFPVGTTQFVFDPVRGTSSVGQVNLEASNGNKLQVRVSALGRVEVCTPDDSVEGYEDC
jgi:type IV fimbrial biogenesis protein FimT